MVSLRYDEQSFFARKNSKSRKQKRYNKDMIIYDRLRPMDENLSGQFEYYVPETNIFDGFVFNNGKWVFIKDIDARNPEKKSSKKPPKKVEYDLFPPKEDK
jgi:hypothetical protein